MWFLVLSKMPKRPRTELTAEIKKDICAYRKSHPKASQDLIAGEVGTNHGIRIGRSTIGDVLRCSEKWLELDLDPGPAAKRIRPSKHRDLERALFLWHTELSARRVAHSDEMLQTKAKEFGEKLGVTEFAYSKGWLASFKKRHGIKQYVRHGEAASVDAAVVVSGREKLRATLSEYALADIYNFDETGLFFRLEPNRTLATGPVSGSKICKERITLGVCANADGSDKIKPFVIGKSARPRCFPRNWDVQQLVTYRNNTKAWMTAELFGDFLRSFYSGMRAQDRHVLLLLDNASSHKCDFDLSHTTLEFLPPNTTSKLQPMDAGIIQNFKVLYKKQLIK